MCCRLSKSESKSRRAERCSGSARAQQQQQSSASPRSSSARNRAEALPPLRAVGLAPSRESSSSSDTGRDLSGGSDAAEPPTDERVGVLLMNLGGPETLDDVQPFLYNLFADDSIIRLPPYGEGCASITVMLLITV